MGRIGESAENVGFVPRLKTTVHCTYQIISHIFLSSNLSKLLTNITVFSQRLLASEPCRNFDEFSQVRRHRTSEKRYVVKIHIRAIDFHIVVLMNDATHMNISTNYCASLICRLTSIHLIVNVRSIELRRECWKLQCAIALELSVG